MDINLDTFLLIGILACVFIHMRVNEKDHEQTRDKLQRLLETNIEMHQTIKSIDYKLSDKWYPQITE